MSTKVQERQRFIRYYKEQTGATEVDMHDVARFAEKMGWPLPVPADPLDLLAKQFSEAAGEEVRRDKQTTRPYKANHALIRRLSDGTQKAFWIDTDEAPRNRMVQALANYRDQMVGEAVIGTNTADHWNRIHPDQQPLVFEADFTDDVEWRLNSPDNEEKAG